MRRDLIEYYSEKEDKYREKNILIVINALSLFCTVVFSLSYSNDILHMIPEMFDKNGFLIVLSFIVFLIPLFYSFSISIKEFLMLLSFSNVGFYEDLRALEKYSFEVLLSEHCSYMNVVAKRKWLKLTEAERRKILSFLISDNKKMELRKRLLMLSNDKKSVKKVKKIEKTNIIMDKRL